MIGSALGNLSWILFGTNIHYSYMLDHSEVPLSAILRMIISFKSIKENMTYAINNETEKDTNIFRSDLFSEELNPYARHQTYELIIFGILFALFVMASSFNISDVLTGRASFIGKIICIITICA